ncbi:MAG TPA: hypothetical protein VM364_21180 [Vicinamibacterales bacterium]|nr:hypothetical protein [Vicinamibacterales bacterium]
MWPRVVEVMLGAWLLVSPFVFRGTPQVEAYVLPTVGAGVAIVAASLLSFWHRAAHARFVTLAASLWLMLHGYFSAVRPGPPPAQNELTVGMLLLLFAILPNETNQPPHPWRRPSR